MKSVTRIVHYCDFCSKRYMRKPTMELHEKYCLQNPLNKPHCFEGCRYLVREKRTDGGAVFDGNPGDIEYDSFVCAVYGEMHTAKAELKIQQNYSGSVTKELFKYIVETTKRMPTECLDFKK